MVELGYMHPLVEVCDDVLKMAANAGDTDMAPASVNTCIQRRWVMLWPWSTRARMTLYTSSNSLVYTLCDHRELDEVYNVMRARVDQGHNMTHRLWMHAFAAIFKTSSQTSTSGCM
jgi:hypothetical protein